MRFSPSYTLASYLIAFALLGSGVAWIVADQLKVGADTEFWQRVVATSLMVHGGAAMAALLLLGALGEVHMRRAWRARRNRATGVIMVVVNGSLIASAFALYYSGSETLRPWISNLHIAFGIALPLFILAHIAIGRHSR